jgi:hypothetical protein
MRRLVDNEAAWMKGLYLQVRQPFRHDRVGREFSWVPDRTPRLHVPAWERLARINVGMRGEVCPATTLLPVFQRITAPKALHVYPDLTHTPCMDVNAHARHWLRH